MDPNFNETYAQELMILFALFTLLSSILAFIFASARVQAAALPEMTATFVVESTLFFCEIVLR
ncbi:MAG: hypothetical protein AAF633_02895 [Chloroflexota bacterium]